jgi:hypothetical protein
MACLGDEEICMPALMGKPDGKRQPERLGHRWENYIEPDLQ